MISSSSSDRGLNVMVVAASTDLILAARCLRSLATHLPQALAVRLVTNDPVQGQHVLDEVELTDGAVVPDDALLSRAEQDLPGWYRQQVLKLRAGSILSGDVFAVMSGDTWLLRRLGDAQLFARDGRPYLQVNRYRRSDSPHLAYERRRVEAVAQLLGVEPVRSRHLGDFICDFFCFERVLLDLTLGRLAQVHGPNWTRILHGRDTDLTAMAMFGEYTTYAVAALEIAASPPPIRISRESHVLQIHSRRALREARYGAPILHLVDKSIQPAEVDAAIDQASRRSEDGPNQPWAGRHPEETQPPDTGQSRSLA